MEQIHATSWAEAIGAITALISVWLCLTAQLNTWIWGIVSVIAYGVFYWQSRYYANAWLQIAYYLPISFYGWWAWLRQGPKHQNDLPVRNLKGGVHALYWLATLPLSALIVYYLMRTDDVSALWDGVTTGLSIVAQYMQTRKWLPNWYMWVVADAIYVALLSSQHHYLTAIVNAVFTIMCVRGYREWVKLMHEGKAHG